MTNAAIRNPSEIEKPTNLVNEDLRVNSSAVVNTDRNALSQHSFAENREVREQAVQTADPFHAIIKQAERLQQMWVSGSEHFVTVAKNANGEGVSIVVFDTRQGSREIATTLLIDENPVSVVLAPDRQRFLVALKDSIAEYEVRDGKLKTSHVYQADQGSSISRVRYEGDSIKISFAVAA